MYHITRFHCVSRAIISTKDPRSLTNLTCEPSLTAHQLATARKFIHGVGERSPDLYCCTTVLPPLCQELLHFRVSLQLFDRCLLLERNAMGADTAGILAITEPTTVRHP